MFIHTHFSEHTAWRLSGQGAYAGSPIARELLTAMQRSDKMVMSFQDLQKRTITVPVPLAGFADAYQKLP